MYDDQNDIDLEKDFKTLLPLFAVLVIVGMMAVLAAYGLLMQVMRLFGV